MLAKAAVPGTVLWPLLLGSALTLVTATAAQWSSLAYQSRRQREARRADFQRSALIQIRDELLALTEATRTVLLARYEAKQRAGWDALSPFHPAIETVRGIWGRLRILSSAVEDAKLRSDLELLGVASWFAAQAPNEKEATEAQQTLIKLERQVVTLLGDQLRRLP